MSPSRPSTPSPASSSMATSSAFGNRGAKPLSLSPTTSANRLAAYLKTSARDGTIVRAPVITMRRLLIGYVIGLIGGLPLGLLTARWELFHDTVGTLALGLQTLPSVCWVPLALLWFGQTEAAMLFVVVM